ncbi:DUF6783 domain-containing protein [uncultured Robinsoniella sp.]
MGDLTRIKGRVAGYVTWIRINYAAKLDVQMSGMNFETRFSTTANVL